MEDKTCQGYKKLGQKLKHSSWTTGFNIFETDIFMLRKYINPNSCLKWNFIILIRISIAHVSPCKILPRYILDSLDSFTGFYCSSTELPGAGAGNNN